MTPFEDGSSSSFQDSSNDVQISYGSGQADGTIATDTVSIGGFTVADQTLGASSRVSLRLAPRSSPPFALPAIVHSITDGLKVNNVSGLMGLGFASIATTKCVFPPISVRATRSHPRRSTPFWQTLVNNNAWAQPVMGFYVARWLNASNPQEVEPGGVFTMGGTNTSLYTGDVDFIDLPNGSAGGFWSIPIECEYRPAARSRSYSYHVTHAC